MKSLKRLLVLFVTVAMMMTMCLPMMAKAAAEKVPATGTNQDTGTITIKGVESDVTVKAYPIVEATYDKDNFTGYKVVSGYSIANIEAPTAEELATIADTILADKDAVGMDLTEGKDSANTVIYSKDNVKVGMYIVLVTGAEATVYNPAVVSVNYVNEAGKTVISGDTTDFGESKIKTASGEATVKKSNVPEVDKVITDATNKTKDGKGSSVNIGDSVSYKVTVGPIPSYTGKYPKLNVVDTLSKGLTYNKDLVVKVGETILEKGTDYTLTVSEDGQTITVNFVVGGKYTLNQYVGKAADITYSATLNDKAAINDDNNNDVTLNYTKDSKSEGNDGDDHDKTYTYTFDIDGATTGTDKVITKVGEGTVDEKGLDGATFALYTDKDCKNVYSNTTGSYDKIISSNGGKLHVTGLAAGTYYLQEKSAPEGYSVNTHVFTVIIKANYNDNGTLKDWSYTIDDKEVLTVNHDVEKGTNTPNGNGATIKNTKLSTLPSTGGMGTYIFTIVGVVIMVVAAGFLFLRRKESK